MNIKDYAYSPLWNLTVISVGSILFAMGAKGVVLHHQFITGGIFGLGLLLYYQTHWLTPGVWYLVLNIPLFILGWVLVSRRFFLYSLYAMIVTTIAYEVLRLDFQITDQLYAAIAGGVICGTGGGIVLRSLGSGGGLDIIAVILNQRYNLGVGRFYLLFNMVLFSFSLFYMKTDLVIASIILVFIMSTMVDYLVVDVQPTEGHLYHQRQVSGNRPFGLKRPEAGGHDFKGPGGLFWQGPKHSDDHHQQRAAQTARRGGVHHRSRGHVHRGKYLQRDRLRVRQAQTVLTGKRNAMQGKKPGPRSKTTDRPAGVGNRTTWGWALYDWANSAFATTVMAGFFPIFFKQYWCIDADINVSTARLGLANAVAGIVVAVMAPVLGAMADRGGARKRFLLFFAYLGVVMTAGLFWVEKGKWEMAAVVYVMAIIGFSGANVFYDALLPYVAAPEHTDTVSSLGFSMGYLGGGLLFALNVIMTLKPHLFGLPDAASAVRLSFLTVALWWGGFTIFTLLWVPAESATVRAVATFRRRLAEGIGRVWHTFKKIRELKTVSHIPAGLLVLHRRGGHHRAHGRGLWVVPGLRDLGPDHGAAARAVRGVSGGIGLRRTGPAFRHPAVIFFAIGVYMAVTLWAAFMTRRMEFYAMAGAIGLVQGGIQALSRSYYARLIPKERSAEFFGFYNMLGKFAAIIGPVLMGTTGLIVRRLWMPPTPTAETLQALGQTAARWSIVSVLPLFIAGGILFYFAKDPAEENGSDSSG